MANRHLVFIHGFLEHAGMWRNVLQRISKKDYIIQTPELPGHGQRMHVRVNSTALDYCRDILEQLQLGPDDRVFVVGHSMGGYLASTLVSLIPDQVDGLCLFHSKAGADDQEKINNRHRAIAAAQENQALYVRGMITGLYTEKARERFREAIEEQIAYAQSLPIEAIVAAQQVMIERPDQCDFMRTRRFQLFYFLGDTDPSLPLEVLQKEYAAIPGAVANVIQGIGHMGHIENLREGTHFLERIIRSVGWSAY